jgi:hypothetical protein
MTLASVKGALRNSGARSAKNVVAHCIFANSCSEKFLERLQKKVDGRKKKNCREARSCGRELLLSNSSASFTSLRRVIVDAGIQYFESLVSDSNGQTTKHRQHLFPFTSHRSLYIPKPSLQARNPSLCRAPSLTQQPWPSRTLRVTRNGVMAAKAGEGYQLTELE